jgi:Zn-dependent peptidase ImmA (M78 family)
MDQAWSDTIDDVVEEILQQTELPTPPINMLEVCQVLDFVLAIDDSQPTRARHKRAAGRHMIFLKSDERPERLHWAAAHEVGEAVAYRVFERMNVSEDEIFLEQREQVANVIASRLLLPKRWFFDDARALQGDLLELKARYSTASHELIAWRLLDLSEQRIISIFDGGRLTRRRSNLPHQPPKLQRLEIDCWETVHHENRPVIVQDHQFEVRGWPVHEAGWKREVICTVPL